MIIVVDAPLPDAQRRKIREFCPDAGFVDLTPFGARISKEKLRNASVIYTTVADFDPADAPDLKWVQTDTAATNPLRGQRVASDDTPVANARGAYSVPVAEFAFGLLLFLTRKFRAGVEYQSRARWPDFPSDFCGTDLFGKTVGIVGYGSIGRQIARLATAFGMSVLACKRRPDKRRDESPMPAGTGDPDGTLPKVWYGQGEIAAMFARSDVAIICLPDVPSTAGIIGEPQLRALPKHAFLVNVGRGSVVDEASLFKRLQSGLLAGAGLDVFASEPLPPTSPFWRLPNVIVMPHVASYTEQQADHAAALLVENIRRHLAGQPLLNLIDKTQMY